MKMIEVKTAELSGAALDWAVAKANGLEVQVRPYAEFCNASTGHKVKVRYHRVFYEFDGDLEEYSPSVDWSQGGPILERFNPHITYHNAPDKTPMAVMAEQHPDYQCGDTILIAACRAIVAAKLGDTVQVPAELVGVRGNE